MDVLVGEEAFAFGQNQCVGQDFVHVLDGDDLNLFDDHGRDVLDIFFVLLGDDNLFDAAAVGRDDLLLEPADGQHPAAQGDFAGHGHLAVRGPFGKGRDDGGAHGNAGRWTVLGYSTFGNVDMQVELAVELAVDAEQVGP